MYEDMTDPEKIDDRRRKEEIKQRLEEKQDDVGPI